MNARAADYERVLQTYWPALYRLSGAYCETAADREDLCQEIAVALWRALPSFRGASSERTWLYRIAHNVAITATARRRRVQRRELAFDGDYAGLGNPEDAAMEAEQERLLLHAVRELEGVDKQVVLLHLEGLSNSEVAEVAGSSEGAVATRLTRLRQRLAQKITGRVGHGR